MTDGLQADREARSRALDPAESFIVQAPAGSGKTELLTQRFLALLARVEHPEEVLALTFTRKAAGEMRNRILEALALAEAPPAPDEEAHKRLTRELGEAVLAADRARGWELRRHPARLRVMTIDALCAGLARRLPVLSGFGAAPRIIEDPEPLYREAARMLIAELETDQHWSPAVARLLRHLDNNLGDVENLIAKMLARREQWLRHTVEPDRGALEASLSQLVQEALNALCAAIPASQRDELIALLTFAAANLARESATPAMLESLQAGRLPGSATGDASAWREIAGLLLKQDGEWRKSITKHQGFPARAAGADAAEKARFDEMKTRMQALLEALATEGELQQRLQSVLQLPPPAYSDEQWEMLSALSYLLKVAVGILDVTFRDRNEADFARVASAALSALGSEEQPADLALQLDYRIRHLLIDEFQDTALGQYQLIERLTAGWEPDDGRTLFVVGDPMQSIYRFREAEVGLYLQARRQGIGAIRLTPLQLVVNYRSQSALIDWVNQAFTRILPAHEDIASGAVRYSPALAHHAPLPGAAVTINPFIGAGPEAEAAKVVDTVRAALSEQADGSVAVLVRSRNHLAAIIPRLHDAGLRFRAVEIERLTHRSVIQDLLSLCCALTHVGDRLSWLAVLRAPWCGLDLHELHALVDEAPDATVWALMNDRARTGRLGVDARQRLERVRVVLAAAMAQRRRFSLRRQVEGVWLALSGPACCGRSGDLEDAAVLFDLLDGLGDGGDLVDRQALARYMEKLFARPDAEGDTRLQIMTIHKAKGLEFDTVIVPGLGRQPGSSSRELLMWLERPQGDLLLAPIHERGGEEDPIYHYIARLDREKSRLEDGRLLYVAATRARQRLHLFGEVKGKPGDDGGMALTGPRSQSLLMQLWPVVEPDFVAATAAMPAPDHVAQDGNGDDGAGAAVVTTTIRRLATDWRLPAPPAALSLPQSLARRAEARSHAPVEFLWAGEAARHVGTVTHLLLQHCARSGVTLRDQMNSGRLNQVTAIALQRLGMPGDALAAATARVVAALDATLGDERGRWILDPGHRDAHCEYALGTLDARGMHKVVIDRTFVDSDGVRWIIDYKTGSHQGSGVEAFLDREQARYREQLERYADIMRRRESRPIRLGLYFPLLQGWREWEVSVPGTEACP